MTAKDHKQRIAVVMPYHNNLYDLLKTLSKDKQVYAVTPRSFRKETHLAPPVPTQKLHKTPRIGPITHAYNPLVLWKAISSDTTHLLIKHIDLLENFVPILIAKLKKVRTIAMVQQVNTSGSRAIIVRAATWIMRKTNTAVFSVTENGYQTLKPLLPNIVYIPACIDPTRFSLADLHTQKPETLRILTIGKYIRRKNFIPLIQALSNILTKYPNIPIQLTLIGPKSDPSVYNEITKIVSETPKLRNAVHIHTNVPPENIPEILASHNLFILPATSEPLGYSILEAMAAGLPVITTPEVGSSSYIDPGQNGYIIPDATPQAIETAILSFTTPDQALDEEKIRRFGRHSRTLVEAHHSPDAIIHKIDPLFV